jgi:hypothetical protein
MGVSLWFISAEEMVAFVRRYFSWYHPGPSDRDSNAIAEGIRDVVDSWRSESTDLEELRRRINHFMRGYWQIEWCGEFSALCTGDSPFAERLRREFLADATSGDETDKSPSPLISNSAVNRFAEWLGTYGA